MSPAHPHLPAQSSPPDWKEPLVDQLLVLQEDVLQLLVDQLLVDQLLVDQDDVLQLLVDQLLVLQLELE